MLFHQSGTYCIVIWIMFTFNPTLCIHFVECNDQYLVCIIYVYMCYTVIVLKLNWYVGWRIVTLDRVLIHNWWQFMCCVFEIVHTKITIIKKHLLIHFMFIFLKRNACVCVRACVRACVCFILTFSGKDASEMPITTAKHFV